jgi:hypothetical protein
LVRGLKVIGCANTKRRNRSIRCELIEQANRKGHVKVGVQRGKGYDM